MTSIRKIETVNIGDTFGRLTVLEVDKEKSPKTAVCLCSCGKKREFTLHNLYTKNNRSCGCRSKRQQTNHGMSSTRFYNIWCNMMARCNNKNAKNYKHYGFRGIKVDPNCLTFENFKNDMLAGYEKHVDEFGEKNTSLDRINNEGNYCSSNCRWATIDTQNLNKRVLKIGDSGVIGVRSVGDRWQARAFVKSKEIHLGTFDTKDEAILARKKFEMERGKYYGE